MSKAKFVFSIAGIFSSFLINLPVFAEYIGFGFNQNGQAVEMYCENNPQITENHQCEVIHTYSQVLRWSDRIWVKMAENAEGLTWWLDRTEPLDSDGYIVNYIQLIPMDNFKVFSIATIRGDCLNKTITVETVYEYTQDGVNISEENINKISKPLKGTIPSIILAHVCMLTGN